MLLLVYSGLVASLQFYTDSRQHLFVREEKIAMFDLVELVVFGGVT